MLALVRFEPQARRAFARFVHNATQPAHHRRRIGVVEERVPVLIAPVAQNQPVGFVMKVSH